MIRLLPLLLLDSDREQFVRDNQKAFRYGAMEEFGLRNIHFYVNRLGFKIVAYYHEKFPDPAHPSAADGMLKFEKTV